MKSKHLEKALNQFAEEGASKLFKPQVGSGWIVGVVGPLQFDVLASRIEQEYGLPVRSELVPSSLPLAGSPAPATGSRLSQRPTRATWPRTTTATRST